MPELTNVELHRLLSELDDGRHIEFPASYDHKDVEWSFTELLGRIEVGFGCECRVDAGTSVQDASHFGQLVVPAPNTQSGDDLFVRVSNFGKLVVFGLTAPGVHSVEELDLLLATADREIVEQALAAGGFLAIPEDLLWETYEGNVRWLTKDSRSTWFTRFFDYL